MTAERSYALAGALACGRLADGDRRFIKIA
jgi:hypothetical protein